MSPSLSEIVMTWSVSEERRLRGYAVEWLATDSMLLSRRTRLYRQQGTAPPELLGKIPAPWWERAAGRFRLGQRLLRALVYNVVPLGDGSLFVTYGKRVGLLRGGRFTPLALGRPCRVLRGGAAVGRDGCVYFGEYRTNRERQNVRVYRYPPGASEVEVAHVFHAGEVRHVHGIQRDPYDDSLWCLTGDFGQECRMLRTDDGFRTLQTVGSGDESWRCVSLLFTATHIYWATDAEFERNKLYRMERIGARREVLGELDGPTYYSQACGEDLFFGVAAQLCPSQTGRQASLWCWNDGGLERVAAFEKDALPVSLFLPGTLHFPSGPGRAAEFYFHGVGLRRADNRTFRVQRGRPSGGASGADVSPAPG